MIRPRKRKDVQEVDFYFFFPGSLLLPKHVYSTGKYHCHYQPIPRLFNNRQGNWHTEQRRTEGAPGNGVSANPEGKGYLLEPKGASCLFFSSNMTNNNHELLWIIAFGTETDLILFQNKYNLFSSLYTFNTLCTHKNVYNTQTHIHLLWKKYKYLMTKNEHKIINSSYYVS